MGERLRVRDRRRPHWAVVLSLALAACSVEPGELPGRTEPSAIPAAPAATPGFGLLTARGVSDQPCPDGPDADHGCIHLGALVDTSGPFAALGEAGLAGARAFWDHVNGRGGVVARRDDGIEARFHVELGEYVADTGSDPATHQERYDQLAPDVLALALSMGTATTVAAMPAYAHDDMAAMPLSGWSGWPFATGLAGSGASYCLQAVNGLDWARAELGGGTPIHNLVVIHAPDRYGRDVLAGAQRWIDPDDGNAPRIPFDPAQHAVEVTPGGDATPAVERILAVDPEVVVVAGSPDDLATIARETAASGWDGLIVGMSPTFSPSLLDDADLADVLARRYVHIASVGPLAGDARAHRDMRAALGLDPDGDLAAEADGLPANGAWIAGWIAQYPLHHALQAAVVAGDLTPAGVVAELQAASVTYDGALPPRDYAAAPNDQAERAVFVYRPHRDAPLGERLVAETYLGSTARRVELSRPCTDGSAATTGGR